MSSTVKSSEVVTDVKRYEVKYPASEYTYPREAIINEVRIDDDYITVELTDGRILSIPLWWIPSLYNASAEDRLKFETNRGRTMIIWDPDKCAINDEIRILDYLGSMASE